HYQTVQPDLRVFLVVYVVATAFFIAIRRRHTSSNRDWSSDVCSSDLYSLPGPRRSDRPAETRERSDRRSPAARRRRGDTTEESGRRSSVAGRPASRRGGSPPSSRSASA